MPNNLPTFYAVGTASVTTGETTITFSGAVLGTEQDGNIWPHDLFLDPAQPLVPAQRIASVDYEAGTAELAVAWPGDTMTGDPYEVRYVGIIERSTAQSRRLLEQLSVVQANGRGLFYRFDDGTADGDPGSGSFRLNNADPALATEAYIDDLDANGAPVAAEIATWGTGTGPVKGRLWLRSVATPSTFRSYDLTAVTDASGYTKLALDYVGGSGAFSDTEEMMVAFAQRGDQGSGYEYDAEVDEPDDLAEFEDEEAGFRVWIDDLGDTAFGEYAGRSGVAEWNGTDAWSLAAVYTGPKGDQGEKGEKGWSPQLAGETDGSRRVLKLVGYVGGAGDPPTSNVGEYLKADGTFTATIGDAMDIRGPAGANGAGTIASIVEGTGIDVDDTDPANPVISIDPDFVSVPFTPASSSGPASMEFAEDIDNGSNKVTLQAPAALTADATVTLPSKTGTVALESDTDRRNQLLVMCDAAKNAGSYRRYLDTVAFGYKSSGDAHASSTGGAVDTSTGAWKPDAVAGTAIFPTNMTGNSAPSPYVASASHVSAQPYQAFDNSASTYWQGINATVWLKIDRGSGNAISMASYSVQAASGFPDFAPQAWTVEGSNDDSAWTTLDTRSSQTSWSASETRSFTLSSPSAAYRYFRITCTTGNTSGNYIIASWTALGVGTTANAVLILPYETADAARTKVRGIFEIDNVGSGTLGTDWTVEFTCNGGTNWTAASSYTDCGKGQGGRTIVETDEVTCTSGTSVSARIKNLNGKRINVHKAAEKMAA